MKNWCKVVPLEEHDVLVERISNEQDKEAIRASIRVDGVHLVAVLGFGEEEEHYHAADKAFEEYGEANATEFRDGMLKMMEEQQG
jgi:hypothetical protein